MSSQYATLTDFTNYGINARALTSVSSGQITAALVAASTILDGYLNSQFALPLQAWSVDLTMHTCSIALWIVMNAQRGFSPEASGGADEYIRMRYEDAIAWAKLVNSGNVKPPGIVDSSPGNVGEGRPTVNSGLTGNFVPISGSNPFGINADSLPPSNTRGW